MSSELAKPAFSATSFRRRRCRGLADRSEPRELADIVDRASLDGVRAG